ncbi:MAG: class I SAM-dependent methyltransferase, partial [Nitrospirota bacterium]
MNNKHNISRCYLCGEKNFKMRQGKVRDNPSLKIAECTSCGLVFLSSFSHIKRGFYENSGMHEGKINIEQWLKETENDDKRRFSYFKRLLMKKDVLDFGCGAGGFLALAKEVAANVVGVEPEISLKRHFKKHSLKTFRNIDKVSGYFDVITLFHVLEHMPDPCDILKKLMKNLKKNGRIIIEVPSADDALLTLYENEAFSRFTYWSCHLFLFNVKTLAELARQAGLQVNYIKQIQRYPLSNHLHWLAKGKPGGHKTWNFLDSIELNNAYEKQLASIGAC